MTALKSFRSVAVGIMAAAVLGTLAVIVIDLSHPQSSDGGQAECAAAYDSALTLRDTQLVDLRIPRTRRAGPEDRPVRCGDLRRSVWSRLRNQPDTAGARRPRKRR